MNFGEVFQRLLDGNIIKRECWIERKIKMTQGFPVGRFLYPLRQNGLIGGQMLTHLVVTNGTSSYWGDGYEDWEPYVISNSDLFATDWMVIFIEQQPDRDNRPVMDNINASQHILRNNMGRGLITFDKNNNLLLKKPLKPKLKNDPANNELRIPPRRGIQSSIDTTY